MRSLVGRQSLIQETPLVKFIENMVPNHTVPNTMLAIFSFDFDFTPRHVLAKLAQLSCIRQTCLDVTILSSLLLLGYGTHDQCKIVSECTSRR